MCGQLEVRSGDVYLIIIYWMGSVQGFGLTTSMQKYTKVYKQATNEASHMMWCNRISYNWYRYPWDNNNWPHIYMIDVYHLNDRIAEQRYISRISVDRRIQIYGNVYRYNWSLYSDAGWAQPAYAKYGDWSFYGIMKTKLSLNNSKIIMARVECEWLFLIYKIYIMPVIMF